MVFIPNMQISGISICHQIENEVFTWLSWLEGHLCSSSIISVLFPGPQLLLSKASISLTGHVPSAKDSWVGVAPERLLGSFLHTSLLSLMLRILNFVSSAQWDFVCLDFTSLL